MEVILLERVAKLGQMGDIVKVRDGFGRNYLLARGKALRATEDNKKRFESQKLELETRNLELKSEADAVAERLDGQSVTILRQSGESGVLYGSVSTRDIAEALTKDGFNVSRGQVTLNTPIKTLGLHTVPSGSLGHDHRQHRPLGRRGSAPGCRRERHGPGEVRSRRSRPRGRRGAGRGRRRRALSLIAPESSQGRRGNTAPFSFRRLCKVVDGTEACWRRLSEC